MTKKVKKKVNMEAWESMSPGKTASFIDASFSALLCRHAGRLGGKVGFLVRREALVGLRAGYVPPRSVLVGPAAYVASIASATSRGFISLPTLWTVVTTYRGTPKANFFEGDEVEAWVDATADFLSAYARFGSALYNAGGEGDVLRELGSGREVVRLDLGDTKAERRHFAGQVKKHLVQLLGPKHLPKIRCLVAYGSSFRGRVMFPGEDFQGGSVADGEYLVIVRHDLSGGEVAEVAAHEARHIWQHASGRLRYLDSDGERFEWDGVAMERRLIPYERLPFEIDARQYAGQPV